MKNIVFLAAAVAACALGCIPSKCSAQALTSYERAELQSIWKTVASDIQKQYYDVRFNGVDWDSTISQTQTIIEKAPSMARGVSDIATAIDSLHDPQTFFIPPTHNYSTDYGFRMQMLGDRCYVTRVRPGSDAEKNGIKPGELVIAVNDYPPTRKDFWRLTYTLNTLSPQRFLHLRLADSAASIQDVTVAAHMSPSHVFANSGMGGPTPFDTFHWIDTFRILEHVRYAEKGDDLLVVKLPTFWKNSIAYNDIIKTMRKHKAVIIDLRDNPGGNDEKMQLLLGAVVGNNVLIAERSLRSSHQSLRTQFHGKGFTGKLAILVDSNSKSQSELFARVVQLQKRGPVIGDRTPGWTKGERYNYYPLDTGLSSLYGVSISDAKLIMSDGFSLEGIGVTPDIVVIPTPADLAASRDPALVKAAEALDVRITPEETTTLFPYEWTKE